MIEILAVPDCPTVEITLDRLRQALHAVGRADEEVVVREIADEASAIEAGMRGSPTLLIDGVDPFADASVAPSISCRLYGGTGAEAAPSVEAIQEFLLSQS